MNGVSNRIAIALLPHQIFHDCSNDWLKPKCTSVAAPMAAPSIVLKIAAKPTSPINSLSVASVGRSATNRRTSHAPVTA